MRFHSFLTLSLSLAESKKKEEAIGELCEKIGEVKRQS